jgi:hypothetical protein
MRIYVYKDQVKLGPFDEADVQRDLTSGKYSGSDLGFREGDADWQPLGKLYPQAVVPPPAAFQNVAPVVQPERTTAPATPEPRLYRSTTIQKIFFGLAFLGAILAAMTAFAYRIFFLGPTGNLEADLSNIGYRDVLIYATIGFAGMTVFCFLAFLLTFKRKVIRSAGLRIALRIFFVIVLLIGFGNIAYGVLTYLSWRPAVSTVSGRPSAADDMLKALEASESVSGPLGAGAIAVPLGLGLLLFGLSGVLMTTSKGRLAP